MWSAIIILAILALGFLIFFHELGHFTMAKLSGVKVLEFTIGFGPAIFKHEHNGTLYALRIIPFGGAVMMEGEDEQNDEEGSFQRAKIWQRILIVAAGAVMNLILGFLILFFVFLPAKEYVIPQISGFMSGFEYQGDGGFKPGDIINKVDGYKIYLYDDISFALGQSGEIPHDFEIIRDGKKLTLNNLPITKKEYTLDGKTDNYYGFIFVSKRAGFFDKTKISYYHCINFVRLVGLSLKMLVTGAATVSDMSGPVAITSAISGVARQSALQAWYFIAFISVNLGIMNLLPLPALDGGRLVFLIIEAFRGKPINQKYEGYVHFAGMILFVGLFLLVTFNDIKRLISG